MDPLINDYDIYLLREGTHLHAYEKLGAHITPEGVHFAVWSPNASRVSVIGNFNGWNADAHPLKYLGDSGVWAGFIKDIGQGELYKYAQRDRQRNRLPDKADPFAFRAESPPHTASIIWPLPEKAKPHKTLQGLSDPVSIYEVHLSSWKRGPDNRMLTYGELADQLIPYAKWMGFTHIELLPIAEHPFNGSWGYQPIGLYAPSSRFGTPQEFRAFIDRAHAEDLHVLVDWVPGHFPADEYGLERFDGTALYEHADPREGRHRDWDTLIYNLGRTEVANFLLANAHYWLERFGIDGLRVDAVASMLYRDYGRKAGDWIPNRYGGVENLEAVEFLKRMNTMVFRDFPYATTAAEESTSWSGVSRPVDSGGLGFGYKWNMGWMHDTLDYMSQDPIHRKHHHHQMTFGMLYAYSENFILPLSHDEVVYGKRSLLNKMPGDEWQKFANLRAYFGWFFGHPGKKLLFMGGEFAQDREWQHDYSLDWHLLEDSYGKNHLHRGVQTLVRDLNHLYQATPALYRYDYNRRGFEWLEADAADASVYAFLRRGDREEDIVIVVSNFTPVPRNWRISVPLPGFYEEIINTDSKLYGGSGMGNAGGARSEPTPYHGRPHSLMLTLPPLATLYLTRKE